MLCCRTARATGPRWLPRGSRWCRRPITRSCEDWPRGQESLHRYGVLDPQPDGDAGYLAARGRKRGSQGAGDPALLLGAELAVSDHGVVAAFDVPGAAALPAGHRELVPRRGLGG